MSIDPQTNAAGVGRVFRVGDTERRCCSLRLADPQMVPVPARQSATGLGRQAKATLLAAGFVP